MVKTRAERIEPCIPSVLTKQENEVDPAKETKKELLATGGGEPRGSGLGHQKKRHLNEEKSEQPCKALLRCRGR